MEQKGKEGNTRERNRKEPNGTERRGGMEQKGTEQKGSEQKGAEQEGKEKNRKVRDRNERSKKHKKWRTSYRHSINHCLTWSCIVSFISGPSTARILSLILTKAWWKYYGKCLNIYRRKEGLKLRGKCSKTSHILIIPLMFFLNNSSVRLE